MDRIFLHSDCSGTLVELGHFTLHVNVITELCNKTMRQLTLTLPGPSAGVGGSLTVTVA